MFLTSSSGDASKERINELEDSSFKIAKRKMEYLRAVI